MTAPALVLSGSRIMVVDDTPANLTLLTDMLQQAGYEISPLPNGQLALQVAGQAPPDMFLLDINMPGLNGYQVCERLKASDRLRDIPVIFLSAMHETIDKVKAFQAGGVDYITKPFQVEEVLARIRTHLNLRAMQQQQAETLRRLQEAYAALQASQVCLAEDLAEAANYATSLLPPPLADGPIRADWIFMPSTKLGGDSFGYHWIDADHFAVYLIDVCDHGVRAALLSVSVLNVLRSMALPKTDFRDPAQVLAALESTFPVEQQNDLFFTLWYGVYQRSRDAIAYISAGHPPALLLDAGGRHDLKSGHTIVGFNLTADRPTATQTMDRPCDLYVFSDGVYEIIRADDTCLCDIDRFKQSVIAAHAQGRPALPDFYAQARQMAGKDALDDDYSLLRLSFAG